MSKERFDSFLGCLAIPFIGFGIPLVFGFIWALETLIRPWLDTLLLRMHYDAETITAQDLHLITGGPPLTVSNGDILPLGTYWLAVVLLLLWYSVVLLCVAWLLRRIDRYLFAGTGWKLLVRGWTAF